MIDWHCHILPGIDDGPPEMEQSLSMAGLLAQAGFSDVYCTPHLMRGCYDAGNAAVREGVAALQELLAVRGIPLKLHTGREYCLDEYLLTSLEDPLPLGDSLLILVEIQPGITADMVRQVLYSVVRSGFTPVIAHPERCRLLEPSLIPGDSRGLPGFIRNMFTGAQRSRPEQPSPDASGNPLLDYLRDLGCSFQGNLGSFNGYYGSRSRQVAETLRRLGIYDRYGSDLHAPAQAPAILGT
ncbi:MAG: phosphoesterase [Geobacteraceae bacterium]|nr:phosphoesterase [Geobacteraceae bacterium]